MRFFININVLLSCTLCLCALCLLPTMAQAVCVCGYDDGRFTTDRPISLDGQMGDWADVLSDTDNNVCDGGSANGITYEPQPDLDAPVQSTGRDLLHFAYTWDDYGVYAYTARAASQSNIQTFIYYADANNNGLMETGERVILASWQGNNRSVKIYYGTYEQAAPRGDAMVKDSRDADGYTLPGRILNVSQRTQAPEGNWGASDGLSMEWSASWADLGVPVRSAFTFHVSSTNTSPQSGSLPGQIDDNMGGCGGGPVSTQYADLNFVANESRQGFRGGVIHFPHTLTNAGNGRDFFDLTSTAGDYAVNYYHDQDGSGTLTMGDSPLGDTDGDGIPDSGQMDAGASIDLLVAVSVPDPAVGADIETIATSNYDHHISAAVIDTVIIANLTFSPDRTLAGNAGTTVYADHSLVNTGNGLDTFNFSSVTSGNYSPVISFYHDLDGSGTLTTNDYLFSDTDGDGLADTGPLPAGADIDVLIAYAAPMGSAGTVSVETFSTSGNDPGVSASVTDTLPILRPSLTIVKSANKGNARPGETIVYTVQVINAGNAEAVNVVLDDHMSRYTAFGLGSFHFVDDSTSPSGLELGTTVFSDDGGDTYDYTPEDLDGDGYDGNVTNWKIMMDVPTRDIMPPGGKFFLHYRVRVK